mmetsp:Transcript_5777/g.7810  ORF Transcript_5777/g.7810 Transcript_5777/m.7810 type:complete len:269 (+) Transcript_5777:589-1395(+)
MLHGSNECLDHAQGVEGGLLTAQVRLPHVRYRPVRRLKLLDHDAVLPLPNQVGGHEAGGTMHLCDLIREHVAIIVVRGHAKAPACPSHNLHGGGVGNEVLQLASAPVQQPDRHKLLLVMLIKDLLHDDPESLLPLEDCLLGDHVGRALGLQAAVVEVMRQVLHVVQRVVVGYHGVLLVRQDALVHHLHASVLREEEGRRSAGTHSLEPCSIFTTDSMPLENYSFGEAEFHPFNVNCIARNGDAIPTTAHGTIWAPPCLLQSKLFFLKS